MRFEYTPSGVCSQKISFDIEDDIVKNISFVGGCPGNLSAISKICDGMTIDQIEKAFLGNTCRSKNTSCADQFARALQKAKEELNK